jgi:N-acylneuraminate cytidylyltransferase
MIAWSIEAARDSNCFDCIIVSTDDQEIADVARDCGADVPFMRPCELADDHAGTIAVIAHAIQWLQEHGGAPTEVCCIYATAPFVRPTDLQRGLEVLLESGSAYAFSVTRYASPIQRAIRITEQGRVAMFNTGNFNIRSQDLEEAYHDAAQFYWGRVQSWLVGKPMFSAEAAPVILPRHLVEDIDTPEDWARAELMYHAMVQSEAISEKPCQ